MEVKNNQEQIMDFSLSADKKETSNESQQIADVNKTTVLDDEKFLKALSSLDDESEEEKTLIEFNHDLVIID